MFYKHIFQYACRKILIKQRYFYGGGHIGLWLALMTLETSPNLAELLVHSPLNIFPLMLLAYLSKINF
jgi:hypothetical protein